MSIIIIEAIYIFPNVVQHRHTKRSIQSRELKKVFIHEFHIDGAPILPVNMRGMLYCIKFYLKQINM